MSLTLAMAHNDLSLYVMLIFSRPWLFNTAMESGQQNLCAGDHITSQEVWWINLWCSLPPVEAIHSQRRSRCTGQSLCMIGRKQFRRPEVVLSDSRHQRRGTMAHREHSQPTNHPHTLLIDTHIYMHGWWHGQRWSLRYDRTARRSCEQTDWRTGHWVGAE